MRTRILLNRLYDPLQAGPGRAATVAGATVGALVAASVATSRTRISAPLAGLAAAIAVSWPSRHMLRAQQTSAQEARDLWGLTGTIVDGRPWPAPGGWALGADALALLIREIRARGLRTVVELGPGTSSVILGRSGLDLELHGLEHDEQFARVIDHQLEAHGVDGYNLIRVPLKQVAVAGREVEWYDPAYLASLPPRIDVLIVDGPPNWKGSGNRSAAWPQLGDRMGPGGLVIVDDTHRVDERRMAMEWAASGALNVLFDAGQYIALEVPR